MEDQSNNTIEDKPEEDDELKVLTKSATNCELFYSLSIKCNADTLKYYL